MSRTPAVLAPGWLVIYGALMLGIVALSACGMAIPPMSADQPPAVAPQATESVMAIDADQTETASAATAAPIDTATVGTLGADAPVTPIMEKLGLEGEPYAALGDPDAPITVIEFSDYG